MKTPRAWIAVASFVLATVFAWGRARQETAPIRQTSQAPSSQVHLRITEPPDGAIIPGRSVRVAVAKNVSAERASVKPAPPNGPPEPEIIVLLDGARKATIVAGESALMIDDVPPGRHRLTVMAKGQGDGILDRQDASFTMAAIDAPS